MRSVLWFGSENQLRYAKKKNAIKLSITQMQSLRKDPDGPRREKKHERKVLLPLLKGGGGGGGKLIIWSLMDGSYNQEK